MKLNHRVISSRTELLAKEMRERALLIEGNPTLTLAELHGIRLRQEREKKLAQVEAMKKLYFNAGRWAGGARDHIAREAFEQMNGLER
jgi:hypothetical protein